jgi:site-specific DNA-methyltransferase (adenine-specific)
MPEAIERSTKLYFKTDTCRIYHDDILTTECIPPNSIDLIVTSPPYNVDIPYNSHDDKLTYDHYLAFTRQWLAKCYPLVKSDGRLCLNIPLDKNKGGQQSVCADITTIAKQIGWKYHSTIVWNEQNISRRTAWGSWRSASAPFVIAPVEVIVVLYRERWKKTSGSGESDISRDEFMAWTNGVWTFNGENRKRVGHPAPFPVELPRRCIKLFSFVGDTVLDPFLGSGSTLIACAMTGRQGIGIEIDEGYCELAKQRIMKEFPARTP